MDVPSCSPATVLQAAQVPLVATLESRAAAAEARAATAESKLATAIAIIDQLAARLRVANAAAEPSRATRSIVRPVRHVHHREPAPGPAIVKVYEPVPVPAGSILSIFA